MRLAPIFLLTLLALPLAGATLADPDYEPVVLERLVFEAINRTRRAYDLAPLQFDARLAEAARLHSVDLARTGATGHQGSDGSRPADRMRRQGTRGFAFAENVYRGPLYAYLSRTVGATGPNEMYRWERPERLARLAVDGWMSSTGHRANLLDPDLEWAGVGVALDQHHRWILTLDLSGR